MNTKKLSSTLLCGLAAAAFALPAAAADENTARSRAGANASTEGGASLGATGVTTQPGTAPRAGDNAGAGERKGDAQARHSDDDKAKPEKDKRDRRIKQDKPY
jgi:hypothetical protein